MLHSKMTMVTPENALAGRSEPIIVPGANHYIFDRPLQTQPPAGMEAAIVGMGCFWGAERLFWTRPGVFLTLVGYSGGITPNPTYEEVCTGLTGHAEIVEIIFDPAIISFSEILKIFWENHDPTQLNYQGNDRGTQYRSAIYTFTQAQEETAQESKKTFGAALQAAGFGAIVTEILPASRIYMAENYHQQYLAKNPRGYCGISGLNIAYPSALPEK